MGKSEITWLPVLAGTAGSLGVHLEFIHEYPLNQGLRDEVLSAND